MSNCTIIIPALNPPENLIDYTKTLISSGIPQIIVVNDGSNKELAYIFTALSNLEGCIVLTHEANKGKGCALKTAFQYVLKDQGNITGIITADADGQHSIADVLKVANELDSFNEGIILGVRDFSQANVPVRSYMGNKITSSIFRLFYGGKLQDTQTGLRGIPISVIPDILELKGNRYEYEMNMLIFAKKMDLKIKEMKIQTLYFQNNSGSHYRSIIDSLRVFMKLISGLVKYSFSTLASGIIDIVSFVLLTSILLILLPLKTRVFFATLLARILSSSCNFYMNRKLVFKGDSNLTESFIKYYLLFFGLIIASYLLVLSTNLLLGINIVLAKICIDALLGIISYKIQLHWVFRKRGNKTNKHLVGENHES